MDIFANGGLQIQKTIGIRITELRNINGQMTQAQLAELMHVSEKLVSDWEYNRVEPSIENLEKLSELFNCTVDYLLTGKYRIKRKNEVLEHFIKKSLYLIISKDHYTERMFQVYCNVGLATSKRITKQLLDANLIERMPWTRRYRFVKHKKSEAINKITEIIMEL